MFLLSPFSPFRSTSLIRESESSSPYITNYNTLPLSYLFLDPSIWLRGAWTPKSYHKNVTWTLVMAYLRSFYYTPSDRRISYPRSCPCSRSLPLYPPPSPQFYYLPPLLHPLYHPHQRLHYYSLPFFSPPHTRLPSFLCAFRLLFLFFDSPSLLLAFILL